MEKLLRWFNFTLKMIAPRMIREDTRPRSGPFCIPSFSPSAHIPQRPLPVIKEKRGQIKTAAPVQDAAN
jgi:hypothetical protein